MHQVEGNERSLALFSFLVTTNYFLIIHSECLITRQHPAALAVCSDCSAMAIEGGVN